MDVGPIGSSVVAQLYTLGEWTVKGGRQEEFVAAWHEFAEWTAANISGSTWAKLLHDRDAPERFISFGPWQSEEAVTEWRQHPGFRERVAKIQELVDAFRPHDMDVAAEVGPATPDP
jgi:heme-degrading monooxygenase HmoA